MLLIFLLTILVVLISIFFYISFILFRKNKLKKRWARIQQKTPYNLLKKAASILNRIDIIARSNRQFITVNNQISKIYDDIQHEFQTIDKIREDIEKTINNTIINWKKMKAALVLAENQNIATRKIFTFFFDTANQIMHQDKFMRNEFAFYQQNLRKILPLYEEKKNYLPSITESLNKLSTSIFELESDFENIIIFADSHKAGIILRKYATRVLKLINVINEAPRINAILQHQIPHMISQMNQLYLAKIKKFNYFASDINFTVTMKNVSKLLIKAKIFFAALNLTKTKSAIQTIWKIFKILKNAIHSEIRCQSKFYKNYYIVCKESKKVLDHYIFINAYWININLKDKKLRIKINLLLQEISALVLILEKKMHQLPVIFDNKNLLYSAKNLELQKVLYTAQDVVVKFNQMENLYHNNNSLKEVYKSKLLQVEKAWESLSTNIKTYNVKLTTFQKQQWVQFAEWKLKLKRILLGPTTRSYFFYVGHFLDQFILFHEIINHHIELAYHAQNMLKELKKYSPELIESNLCLQMKDITHNYLAGKYFDVLSAIIQIGQKRSN